MKIKKIGIVLVVAIFTFILLVICWKQFFSQPKPPENLEMLLNTIFTLPDKELASGRPRPEGGDRLNDRIVEIVAPYCSEEKMENVFSYYLVSELPFVFLSSEEEESFDQSMQVKDCAITPQKGKENSYDWAVVVTYGPNGTGTEMQFTGSARCDAEGKVEYWALSNPSQKAAWELYKEFHPET